MVDSETDIGDEMVDGEMNINHHPPSHLFFLSDASAV